MSTRRGFIGGLVAVAAALVVPDEVQRRRFWRLDSSMVRAPLTWRDVDPLTVVPEYGPEGLRAIAEGVKNWNPYSAADHADTHTTRRYLPVSIREISTDPPTLEVTASSVRIQLTDDNVWRVVS